MLDDPIKEAAASYMDNILVLKFDDDARALVLKQLEARADSGADESIDQEKARRSAIRLVQEAANEARRRGADFVDVSAVRAAWIRLCPGFYPFC
jgi:hypothetical protein